MFESRREQYVLREIKNLMPTNKKERDDWIIALKNKIDEISLDIEVELTEKQQYEANMKIIKARRIAEREHADYLHQKQLTQDQKNFAKTEAGMLKQAEKERKERLASWRAMGYTDEEIKLKSMTKNQYVDYVNQKAKEELDKQMKKGNKESKLFQMLDDITP